MTKARRMRGALPTGGQGNLTESVRQSDRFEFSICRGVILCLFLFRFYYVAESADDGETLGVVGGWLAALAIWTIVSWKSAAPVAPFGWFDLGVGLLAAGHIISALVVVATSGDKRSAMNLAWEWVGVAIGWFLLRQECRQANFRRELLAGLIATGACVAGLGLFQHYIEFPRMAAKFGPMFDRLKHADGAEAAVLRQAMAKENIPIEGPSVTLFEKRLRDSREPLGFFALANTLGGFLAVCLILSISVLVSARNKPGVAWSWLASCVAIMAVIAWCLLLTKSRTAWIGTAVGVCLLTYRVRGSVLTRSRVSVAVGSLVLLGLAAWGLSRVGGLDRQVFTEAPKSLQYRLQYWSATSRMVWDHLLMGVGPGQFRGNYLFYKLPEASEEIADPHNLFLDVTANGGIGALTGLIIICVFTAAWLGGSSQSLEECPSFGEGRSKINVVMIVFASVAWLLLLFTGIDDRLLFLLPAALFLFWLLNGTNGRYLDDVKVRSLGCWSAAIGLLVHLCGAGGIGMPAVNLLLLALIAIGIQPPNSARVVGRIPTSRIPPIGGVSVSVITISLLVAWYVTGYQPVSIVHQKLLAGDQRIERSQFDAADVEYSAASEADRWASEPWRRRAEIAYRKGIADEYRSNDSFQIAVNLLQEARRRDPDGFRDDRRLGEWWFARWLKSANEDDAREALKAFNKALERYPTNSQMMSQVAFSLDVLKMHAEAREIAAKALRQDEINHNWGHMDRFLDDVTRRKLEQVFHRQSGPVRD